MNDKTKEKKGENRYRYLKIFEVILHLFLLVVVPVVYLYITTGFNKYRLPEHINYVYGYWLVYIILLPIIYSFISRK